MKIASQTSQPTLAPVASQKPPVAAETGPQDQVAAARPEDDRGSIRWGNIALAAGAVAGGAALGALAGTHGGVVAELASLACIPGLAAGGAILGGVGAEKFGPSSSEYRAIGGAILGGVAGAGAALVQAYAASSGGGPTLAATLGVSGALMGAVTLFKHSSHN